jgi:hypothetical protein
MSVPSFSRVEIPTATTEDLTSASRALADLSAELRRIASSVTDQKLMRLAAHDAIRATSSQLRGTK